MNRRILSQTPDSAAVSGKNTHDDCHQRIFPRQVVPGYPLQSAGSSFFRPMEAREMK